MGGVFDTRQRPIKYTRIFIKRTRLFLECTDANRRRRQEPIKDPARLDWHEATKVAQYYLPMEALSAMSGTAQAGITRPMMVREN